MTDAIKNMLERYGTTRPIHGRVWVRIDDFERVKRGFLKLMEQQDKAFHAMTFQDPEPERLLKMLKDARNTELEKAMRGE